MTSRCRISTAACVALAATALAPAAAGALPAREIPSSAAVEPSARVVVREVSGFDWGDALVGAGGALAAVSLVGSGAALRRHRPTRARVAA